VTATCFYDSVNEIALLSASFADANGNPADPTSVSCLITEPSGAAVTHTYQGTAPADIVKVMTGKYSLSVPCSPSLPGIDGLWGYQWAGTGVVSDVQPGTWRVLPAAVSQIAYVGLEEMKGRLGMFDSTDDAELQTAIFTGAAWINEFCGRHFTRITEARTYQPTNVWILDIDDLVDDPSITVTVDQDGDGVFEQPWIRNVDYQLRLGGGRYNPHITGGTRPFRQLQVIQSGKWLPFTWPYSHLDRVRILGPWGWPYVPWQVAEANRILSADLFKMKDAPFGLSGSSDLGVVRIGANPWLVENLRAFVNPRHKVGV